MPALIELSDIHFAYPARPPVLNGAGLTLESGERLCVTGPNGAGKSTLLHIILGLLRPWRGRIRAFGADCVREADFRDVRRRAGLVFQDPDDQLFCPTVAEDIAFGPLNLGCDRGQAMEVVERVLADMQLSALRDRITHKLSGGEKRLVTLATVLAMQPDVLLLDEPTNGLDEENAGRLTEILLALPQAMIVVSHDPHFRRRIATRGLRMQDGILTAPEAACRDADAPTDDRSAGGMGT